MAIIQQPNAMFYHPLDDLTETLQAQAWIGAGESFGAGTVSDALTGGSASGVDGTAIAFGSEFEFLTGTVAISNENVSVATLGTDKFVVAYDDDAFSGGGTVRVATVTGTSITYGTPAIFLPQSTTGSTAYISVVVLSAMKFVVTYSDRSSTPPTARPGVAKVGTVTGTNVTFGAGTEFSSVGSVENIYATGFDAAKFVVAYRSGGVGAPGEARVGAVSGTSVAFAAVAEFDAGDVKIVRAATLSATKFVVAYRDNTSGLSAARAGAVDGIGNIAFGAVKAFAGGSVTTLGMSALDSAKFVVVYQGSAAPAVGSAKIGTVAGTDITFGAEAQFGSGTGLEWVTVSTLSATSFIVAFLFSGGDGTSRVGVVSGTDIMLGSPVVHNAGDSLMQSTAALDSSKFIVAYRDQTNLNHGTAKVGMVVSYPTGVGATRLAFAAWTMSPGPFTGPPPQFFDETDRAMMTAMGMPASRLGGFT